MDKQQSESTILVESLIKPTEFQRFQATKGRTTEKLIPTKKPKPDTHKAKTDKKKLSRHEIAQMGLYAIPDDAIRYEQILPLNRLWRGYMARYLDKDKLPDANDVQYNQLISDLLKTDFHGAKISVIRSKNASLIGIKGIVILDTKGTFKVVSKDNKVRTVPKNESVFRVHWNQIDVTIFGKHLTSRPADRSVKKFKSFAHCDLD